ncbi:hypothetical protein H010_18490 [Hydrogenophaga taeniospiralis CCUG 15921]|uniref:TIGR04438 family Trp-rich protein n=1 Tax=Hydrogenophaga taeniospiralis CCUG 15921 TaxID=1281780 RepID=A0A9X4NTR9_9BURK|nr:TIGR04438 family Trp-rich protein [Hydrogenophaga taeniospiralis]MDG5977257.1 hypothetical protein [Hydrogenophaga taeniospiralis CCUG 15921]
MFLLIAGVALTIWNYLRIGLVADSSWWWVLSPFLGAMAWWAWADATGYTKRKQMEKMDKKKQERIDKQREALGLKGKRRSR